jgi:dipeptide/tripeptide permease
MKFLKRRFANAPEGAAALFFIQIFATLGFAVLYSTLVLYATKHLHLGVKEATALMGVFGVSTTACISSAVIWVVASFRTANCLSEAWRCR